MSVLYHPHEHEAVSADDTVRVCHIPGLSSTPWCVYDKRKDDGAGPYSGTDLIDDASIADDLEPNDEGDVVLSPRIVLDWYLASR